MAPLFLRKQNTLEMLRRFHATGDEALIEAVLKSQQTRVYRLCLRELGNEADAQDAAQTVLMRLVQHAGRIETDLDAWLARTCKNTCISLIRSAAARRKREANTAKSNREAAPLAPDELTEAEARQILQRCLAHLDEADAQLLHQRFVHGTSQSDLAQMLGISQQAVSKRLRRVLASLKGELSERGVQSIAGAVAGLIGGSAVVIAARQAAIHTKFAITQVASLSASLPSKAAAAVTLSVSGTLKTAAACAVACIGLKGHAPAPATNLRLPDHLTESLDALGPLATPVQELAKSIDQGTALPMLTSRMVERQQQAWSPATTPVQQLTGHAAGVPLTNPAYALIAAGSTPASAPRDPGTIANTLLSAAGTDHHIGWRNSPLPAANVGSSRNVNVLTPPPVVQHLPTTAIGTSNLLLSDANQRKQQTPTESPSLIERVQRGVERVLGPSVPKLFNSPPSRTSGPSVPSLLDLPNLLGDAGSSNEAEPATIVATSVELEDVDSRNATFEDALAMNIATYSRPTSATHIAAFAVPTTILPDNQDSTTLFDEAILFAESHHVMGPLPISLASLSVPVGWETQPLVGPLVAIPEPGTAALLLITSLSAVRRRRRDR